MEDFKIRESPCQIVGDFKLKGANCLAPYFFEKAFSYGKERMRELKLYTISDRYIDYLRTYFPAVYSNKIDVRIHTRKYLGIVIEIGHFNYYVPMSSPKPTDYQFAGEHRVIKKSIVPILRIVVKNINGEKELKGTLRISHMIPVPDSELELYDLENEEDSAYKELVQNEMIFIRKNKEKIVGNANLLYKQKLQGDTAVGYVRSALDFKGLEAACDMFDKEK